jgi:hypothetical protein
MTTFWLSLFSAGIRRDESTIARLSTIMPSRTIQLLVPPRLPL